MQPICNTCLAGEASTIQIPRFIMSLRSVLLQKNVGSMLYFNLLACIQDLTCSLDQKINLHFCSVKGLKGILVHLTHHQNSSSGNANYFSVKTVLLCTWFVFYPVQISLLLKSTPVLFLGN